MDLARMIAELQDERYRLDEAIEALERLSVGQAKRRGRPPRSIAYESTDAGLSEVKRSDAVATKAKRSGDHSDGH